MAYSAVILLSLLSNYIHQSLAEVKILSSVQTIYDKSPKLRIKGSGFPADETEIILEIAASGEPALRINKDYTVTKDDDGLILKLLANRKWVDMEDRVPPAKLKLNSVKFESDPKVNVLPDEAPILIANVLPTPSVEASDNTLYMTASNELRINGTGFTGAKSIDLYFQPPLVVEVAYEIVSKFPLSKDQLVLRIRHGYKWRDEAGPLKLVGIDTGGGPVKLNEGDGVLVANVVADLDQHAVSVQATATEQLIYNDEAKVYIKGTGFNPQGTKLRFSNGILGKGVNYTTKAVTEDLITLSLVPESHWRKNVENLPGYLTLLAVDSGEGFVSVGPTNSGKGKDIATVFERPIVHSSNTKLFRTHTHEFHIDGSGFTKNLAETQIKFDPPLKIDVDYSLRVVDRTDLEITLLDGKSWRKDNGPLIVTAINTRGDDEGWINFPGDGVHVADVIDDTDADATGGVEVFPRDNLVYQSAKQKSIEMVGTGFKSGIGFTFDPELKEDNDYTLKFNSDKSITLTLMNGKKWRNEAGFIIVKTVKIDGKSYNLGGNDGIRVATVLADPTIAPGTESFHETQSKVIAISGHGFTNAGDTKIDIRPTLPSSYKILSVLEDTIRLQLIAGNDWLPDFMSVKEEGKKVPLQVTSIDTGAGTVPFANPITIGYIVKDRDGVVCDDSCEFAFDGVCDDGSESEMDDDALVNYADDDLGGYYADKDEEGNGYAYDDYYGNDEYKVSACVEGTDCTDCGGVDAIVDYNSLVNDPTSGVESCTNTCEYARDGVCDDPRAGNYCKLGTDCQDCGPVGADNFTKSDDDGWFDDDDDYWAFNDATFNNQAAGLSKNWDKVKRAPRPESVGVGPMFLVILEGMVYTVGAIFAAAALYLAVRYYKGQPVPCLNAFDSEVSNRDYELLPTKRMPITPDVIRT